MRSPLDGNPPITNEHGNAGWGFFGKHAGIDYGVAVGTPVYAPDNGTIRYAVGSSDGGNMLEIAIGSYWHRFLHLQRFVRTSGTVKKGELIAYSGATGNVTGPHLHWDVRKAGTAWNDKYSNYVNPLSLIKEDNVAKITKTTLNQLAQGMGGRNAPDDVVKHWTKQDTSRLATPIKDIYNAKWAKDFRAKAKDHDKLKSQINELNKVIKVKDNEIAKLKATGGSSDSKWETLKVLIRELIGK